MNTAIKWVTGIVGNPSLKYDQFTTLAWKDNVLSYSGKKGLDSDYHLASLPKLPASSDRCKGYIERWTKHKSYFSEKYNYPKE